MFDEKTILARLQNGEDAQKIADEMAAMINAANKTYNDQKAKEAEEKAQAEKAKVQKKEELQEIIDLFVDWFGTHYAVNVEKIKEQIDADQVIELIDSLQELMDATKNLEAMFAKPAAKAPVTKIVKAKNADETINAFLKNMGW